MVVLKLASGFRSRWTNSILVMASMPCIHREVHPLTAVWRSARPHLEDLLCDLTCLALLYPAVLHQGAQVPVLAILHRNVRIRRVREPPQQAHKQPFVL